MQHINTKAQRFTSKEAWLNAMKLDGLTYSSWGQCGSGHAINDDGAIVGTWLAAFDTHDGKAHGDLDIMEYEL